jgi:hypothetical protein
MKRRGLALLSGGSTAMLILSNLLFLGGTHVGRLFWKRVFVQGEPPLPWRAHAGLLRPASAQWRSVYRRSIRLYMALTLLCVFACVCVCMKYKCGGFSV